MSKVVKGVGRAIGNVVKGVGNVVKKVVQSPIGKIIAGAALVYFGGAALMGAVGGASAGAAAGSGVLGTLGGAVSGGLSGAAAGISNAWAGLTGALSGGGLSALGQGFTGSYGAGAGSVAQAAGAATQAATATPGMSAAPLTPTQQALQSSLGTTTGVNTLPAGVTTGAPAAGAAKPGLLSSLMNNIATSKYTAPTLIQGAFQLGGAALAKKEAEDADEATRARYNANIGGFRY